MNPKDIRIIFFGTPEFAVPSLEGLYAAGYSVVAVVTQPDKKVGRSQELTYSPVKKCAIAHDTQIIQPSSLKVEKKSGQDFFETYKTLHADIAVVVAYGKIIPEYYLSIPRYGFVNVHGSILPALRGPSPIHAAIREGYTESGITIMQLDSGMDTGPMLSTERVTLSPQETTQTLHDTLKNIGAKLLIKTLPHYIEGSLQSQPQNNELATYCHLMRKEDGLLALTDSPIVNERKIRAYTPWPGTYIIVQGKRIKILSAHLDQDRLIIDTLQPEGKKPMPYSEYLKGNAPLY